MPIQREWHYIDRQADREAVDQMLPPVLKSSLIGPTIAQVPTTMGKSRLHVTCHFYSAVVINPVAFVLYQSRSSARG